MNWALWVNTPIQDTEAASTQTLINSINEVRLSSLLHSSLIICFILLLNILVQKLSKSNISVKSLVGIAFKNLILMGATITKASKRTFQHLENDIQNNFITDKQKLVDKLIDMRTIPQRLVSVKRIENFEIGYQDDKNMTSNYNYPNNYSIGVLNNSKDDYKYVIYVKGISPITEFDYLQKVIDKFETDSTYVDVIIKEDNRIRANIYRQTKDKTEEYMMWKWVKTNYTELEFEVEKLMNEHLFVN